MDSQDKIRQGRIRVCGRREDREQTLWNGAEPLLLDGAMGTVLQQRGLPPGGQPELLNLTHPSLIQSIHRDYLAAGSQVIYTNTFGANALKLSRTGRSVREVVSAAVGIARNAVREAAECVTAEYSAAESTASGYTASGDAAVAGTLPETAYRGTALVALDIGPLGELLQPMGTLSFAWAYETFREMAVAGEAAGADLAVIETMTDLAEARAALLAVKENTGLPVFVTMSFENTGRTFTGCTIPAMAAVLEGLGADAIGLNCSLGPDKLAPLLRELCASTSLPVIAKPNAGLPDPVDGHYDMEPEAFAEALLPCLEAGVAIFGGCCGTSPEYIRILRSALSGKRPGVRERHKRVGMVCTPTRVVRLDDVRVIGERINPTGKKRFQRALLEEDMDYILNLAVEQEDAGADILDVNVGFPGIQEAVFLPKVVEAIQGVVSLPLQMDSSDLAALEAGLRTFAGKASVNSVNGNPAVLERILPVVKRYGAAVVGLTLDQGGVPKSAEDRIAIARRILEAALSFGIPREDVWIDCLTLTVSAQQEQARETLRAVRYVREELGLHTVLGISNISFGLPNRGLLARTFLVRALEAGLTLPILNPNQRETMDAVAACRVLSGEDTACGAYIERFAVEPVHGGEAGETPDRHSSGSGGVSAAVECEGRQREGGQSEDGRREGRGSRSVGGPSPSRAMTLDEVIARGMKKEAAVLARAALETESGLTLVEERLIPALDRVGEGYERGTVFLPQLLGAAQAAQAVFEEVRSAMERSGGGGVKKGTLLVATVQGDIHDIGKNIVKTVLENYGYEVVDLGRDVPPETVAEQAAARGIRLVGLSALMTTTLPAMEETIRQLKALDHPPTVFVGGAVLTPAYASQIGADYYAKDARASVAIARKVLG